MSTQTATLTGQDVGEAEGALTGLLERVLDGTKSGLTRAEYITLRVVAAGEHVESAAALHAYLADQPQLGLNESEIAAVLRRLEARGLITPSGVDAPGPAALTQTGAGLLARVTEAVMTVTRRLYAELDPGDLATAHNVLAALTQRARRMRGEL
jgi:DNA-binding MarR family transcriptional regulator